MDTRKKHWVEELFSPRFSAQDFFHESFEPDLLTSEKVAKEKAKRVEGIYQAAVDKVQKEEKQKRKEILSKMIIRDYDQADPAQSATCRYCQKLNTDSVTAVDGNNYCIWNEDELSLLRHEMNKNHSEGSRLKLQFSACKIEISELKAKQKETERELEALRLTLAASKRANECKSVLIKQIQKDGEKKDSDLQVLKKDLQGKCVMLSRLTRNLSRSREEIQDLQFQKQDLEQELKTLKLQQELRNDFAIENVKLQYEVKINKLLREIETIKEKRQK
ncbi:coiled-coil domain-containing protein 160 [Pseudophryne corroboree]|uniref:coiled-coil domain-containing protein 160 n=1 Tax=Pseudophryne corroboree TaxID=495146 RepID=UPI003081415D